MKRIEAHAAGTAAVAVRDDTPPSRPAHGSRDRRNDRRPPENTRRRVPEVTEATVEIHDRMDYQAIEAGDPRLASISAFIRERTGIHIPPAKHHLLVNKLTRLMDKEGIGSLVEIIGLLESGDVRIAELLARYITTTYTYFFREESQLSALVREIIARGTKRPLIWCAASSSGEEVYSIAISLREAGIHEYLLMASDINSAVLRQLHRGVYKDEQLRTVPEPLRRRYFTPNRTDSPGLFRVRPMLKENLCIRRLNLMETIRFERQFDFIFCRNVMIYFDDESRDSALETLERNLTPDGLLFLGKSESLLANRHFVRYAGEPAVYRKRK